MRNVNEENLGEYIQGAAFPQTVETRDNVYHTRGLTKREYFAAMRKSETISAEHAETLMGKSAPQKGSIQYLEYFIEAQERLSVMYADALIKALNEIKP